MSHPAPSEVALHDQIETEIERLAGIARHHLNAGEHPITLATLLATRIDEAARGHRTIGLASMLAVALARLAELTSSESEPQPCPE